MRDEGGVTLQNKREEESQNANSKATKQAVRFKNGGSARC